MAKPELDLLYQHFGQLAKQMQETHKLHRAPLNIVASRELFVSAFLRRHLPKNMWVGRGEILDADGKRSPDCDVVVYRNTSPAIPSDPGETLHLFFAEGVDCVVEVKSNLSKGELTRCIEACRRVKSLRTGSRPGTEPGFPDIAFVPQGYNAEPLSWIRYFVIAFGGLSDAAIVEELKTAYEGKPGDYYRNGIDGVCVLDRSYIYKNDGLIWPTNSDHYRSAGMPLVRTTDDLLCLFLHLVTPGSYTVHKTLFYAHYLQRGAADAPPAATAEEGKP